MRSLLLLTVVAFACVPPESDFEYGSVAFDIRASDDLEGTSNDGIRYRFERLRLSFKTMTIGRVEVSGDDACSFRGKGKRSDTVFDPRVGIVQIFNGVKTVRCPDVGVSLDPPKATTEVGPGATVDDLLEMAGAGTHAIVDVRLEDPRGARSVLVELRLDSTTTSSKFGGCTGRERGITIEGSERVEYAVRFEPDALLSPIHAMRGPVALRLFFSADKDRDGIVTMSELDRLLIPNQPGVPAGYYVDASGFLATTLGSFVREQMKATFAYDIDGRCFGNEPGFGEK